MAFTIRPMNAADDVEQLTDWFESIGDEWLPEYEAAPRSREENRQQLLRWMRGEGAGSCVLVAEGGEPAAVIGFAACQLLAESDTARIQGRISVIYVAPEHRGQGVGHALKDAADKWCQDAGAAYMLAYIHVDNEAMLRLCKLLGYEPWLTTWVRKFE